MLGLIAILTQIRQGTQANVIGAMSARLQFLLSEHDRLDKQIADHFNKYSGTKDYKAPLVDNMVAKRRERLDESKRVDEKLKSLLAKI